MSTSVPIARVHGIVLAGVHAWGENALERAYSRPLLPVAGRPLIWYVLHWLGHRNVRQATICANSDTRVIRHCMSGGDGLGVHLDYYEDVMPRGPAGCMRDAAQRSDADTFVVVDGTIITQMDLDAVLQAHARSQADLTVVVSGTGRGGAMACGQEPVGIYVVSRLAIGFVADRGYQDIKEMLIPALYRQDRRVVPYTVPDGSSLRVAGMTSYLAANGWAAELVCLRPELCAGWRRVGEARIHNTACVAPTACLLGPVLVGPDCTIEGDVTIVGPTAIGAGSYIERDAVIRQTAIWSSCHIGAGAILDDSVVVDGATIEPRLVMRGAMWTEGIPEIPRGAGRVNNYWALPSAKGKPIRQAEASSYQ